MLTPHVVIIGAGVIGLSSACSLARLGARVTVLERGRLGMESSWAGAGILSALPPWDYPRAVTRLISESRRLWPAWAGEIHHHTGIDPEYRVSGLLAMDVAQPERALTWCRDHGWPCEIGAGALDHAFADAPPGDKLRPEENTGANLWLAEVAQVRNPRLVRGLARLARERGVSVLESQGPVAPLLRAGRITGARTPQATHACTHLVVCAGAWSTTVIEGHGPRPPIRPIRGQMLLFKDAPGRLPCILFKNGKYLVPRADGHILAGSTLEDVGFDKSTTRHGHEELLRFAHQTLAWLDGAVPVAHWSGLRPGSPDNVPIIARHPRIENLYMNGGHFRYGVTMAPASAERLGRLIMGEDSATDTQAASGEYPWLSA